MLRCKTPTGMSSFGSADKNTRNRPAGEGDGLLASSSRIFSSSCNHLRVRWIYAVLSNEIKRERNN